MFENDFFTKLSDSCPVPEPTPVNKDSVFEEEPDEPSNDNSTSNEDLLEKISALEKMIAEMKNTDNGNSVQGTSDL